MIRRLPAVSGQFYYGTESRLRSQVRQYIIEGVEKEDIIGAVSPHAGLMYSGHVAGALYSRIRFPETFILIGPNHTGLGERASVMTSGQWEIPTGTFLIDEEVSKRLLNKSPYLKEDVQAHIYEHSLEVQLPFISYFSTSVKIVPITVMTATLEDCKNIGIAIADTIRETKYKITIVASSDMSHYEPDNVARRLDNLAIKEILSLNPEGLYNIVRKERISMCGYLPVTIMLFASKSLGVKEARLIKYATSGDVSGDYESVVGYASIIVK